MMNLLLWLGLSLSVSDMDQVRQLFTSASKHETKNSELLKITDGYTMDYKPVVFAYHAAAEMTMANHTFWPVSKLSYFNSGKDKLEEVVKKYPKIVEIRYIRYAVQKGAPSFLDYKDNMTEDRKMILNNYKKTDWSDSFKNTVIEFVK